MKRPESPARSFLPLLFLRLIGVALVAGTFGCNNPTAPAPYKLANQTRLAAIAPWLTDYANEHPAKAVMVRDVLESWRIEVAAQNQASGPAAR